MGLDGLIRHHADVLLGRRLLRGLLLAPLATMPLTAAIDVVLLGSVDYVDQRSFADVVLLHLPGVVGLYPVYRLSLLGRVNRTLLLPAVLGLLGYLVPQLFWLVLVESLTRVPPLIGVRITVYGAAVQSFYYCLALWCLTWSVYRAYGDRP